MTCAVTKFRSSLCRHIPLQVCASREAKLEAHLGTGIRGQSVHQHREGSGSDRWNRVDQEAAAIGGDGILEQYETRSDDSRLEEDVGNAYHRLVMRGVDCYRHKLFVHGDIEEFFSIRTPAR